MPSVSELNDGLPIDQFKNYTEGMKVSIELNKNNEVVQTDITAAMQIVYSWDSTPVWYHLTSPVMYAGMDVTLLLNPKTAHL
jgi:hypothetical protein